MSPVTNLAQLNRASQAQMLIMEIHELRTTVNKRPDPVHQPERTQEQAKIIKPLCEETAALAAACMELLVSEGLVPEEPFFSRIDSAKELDRVILDIEQARWRHELRKALEV